MGKEITAITITEEKTFKLSLKDFDKRGNFNMNGDVDLRGGEVYVQPPRGWTRKGLMVTSIFDNGNDHWLSMDEKTSWPVAYHGFKNFDFVLPKVIKGNYEGGGLRPG